jgi:hypothetical protein
MKTFAILMMFIYSSAIYSSNFTNYYKKVQQAELKLVDEDFKSSLEMYNQAFSCVEEPFLRDIFTACQIAYLSKDFELFLDFSKQCFLQGMPIGVFGSANIFKSLDSNKELKTKLYQCYSKHYVKNIKNESLRNELKTRFLLDQKSKLQNNKETDSIQKDNAIFLLNKIKTLGYFPSEKYIGLTLSEEIDELEPLKNKKEPKKMMVNGMEMTINFVGETRTYQKDSIVFDLKEIPYEFTLTNDFSMLIVNDDFCPFLANKELLFKMVLNGSLHPRLYAFIIDRGNESNNRACKTSQKLTYNIYIDTYLQNSYKTNINEEETDRNRAKIFLNSKKVDRKKQELEKKYGLKLFFYKSYSIC